MSYNILGINPFHNGSACVLSDGEIVYFLEEERLTKRKHDANPFRVIQEIISQYKIDEIVLAGINSEERKLGFSNEDPFICYIRKNIDVNQISISKASHFHHFTHAYHSFYNSGFSTALGLVFDAGGSTVVDPKSNIPTLEQNSIFLFDSFNSPKCLHTEGMPKCSTPSHSLGMNHCNVYGYFTIKMGFGFGGEGKLMGLSSYGKPNPKIPPLFKNFRTDPNIIWYVGDHPNWQKINKNILPLKEKYNWNNKSSQDYSFEKDLAWRIQKDTQEVVKNYIIKYTQETGVKNIVCSGGYFLNCVANYYLTKELPNLNFYFEPISHDGGTAIGAAYARWKEITPEFKPSKQKTLYYGPKYSKEQLLNGIKKYV